MNEQIDTNFDNSLDPDIAERREFALDPQAGGGRLDKIVSQAWDDLSRSRLQVLIREGRVSIDGATITDPSRRVKPTAHAALKIELLLPNATPAEPVAQAMDLDIRFEDEHLLVINKAAGLVVHPAPGTPDHTLVNALLAHCGDSLSGIGGVKRPGIVHRLDKETSGLLVVAKSDQAHQGLASQFEAHTLVRAYQAVVWGTPSPREGTIEANIGRNPRNRKKMAVVTGGGKTAVTHYRVIRAVGSLASLVECRLKTGRTHQIRVHMANLGHPVIGDKIYGQGDSRRLRRLAEEDRRSLMASIANLNFHLLHAYSIGFEHPVTQHDMLFESDLPNNYKGVKKKLEFY